MLKKLIKIILVLALITACTTSSAEPAITAEDVPEWARASLEIHQEIGDEVAIGIFTPPVPTQLANLNLPLIATMVLGGTKYVAYDISGVDMKSFTEQMKGITGAQVLFWNWVIAQMSSDTKASLDVSHQGVTANFWYLEGEDHCFWGGTAKSGFNTATNFGKFKGPCDPDKLESGWQSVIDEFKKDVDDLTEALESGINKADKSVRALISALK